MQSILSEPHLVQVGISEWQTPIIHEEARTYHLIQEVAAGHFISVVSDDMDVLLILVHHLHALMSIACHIALK